MVRKGAENRPEMVGTMSEGSDRKSREEDVRVSNSTARRETFSPETSMLMEAVVDSKNMEAAYRRVKRNKGAAGIDEMSVDQLAVHLRENWRTIREELLKGSYQPKAVLRVDIPKPGGKGMRMLGIPTVVDRLIQQAIHQVLQPIYEPRFSENSYGFRPGRGAHQAVLKAQEHVASGKRWIVDMDLAKFFDRVNHDILMSRLARVIEDKRMLKLIRRYLQAGMMEGGLVTQRVQGTPQGGPLSPLLSNVLLDELDKELEKRGHLFCRYADDCNIYVESKRAGERVLASISHFLEKRLKLEVNQEKSAVDRPWKRKFLGYSMTVNKKPRLKVAKESAKRLKATLKQEFRRGRGRNLEKLIQTLKPKLRGWVNYFKWAEVKNVFEDLDGWIRRKLRCIMWRQWKRVLRRARNLMKRGIAEERAWKSATNGRGAWWNSGASHMNQAFPKKFFDKLGLLSLLDQHRMCLRLK